MIFQVKQKKQIVKIWMCIALCILFIQHLMLLVETNWRYYPTTYAILWNQFKFFFFNSSGELLFIFSRGINIKKLHIVQPSCPYLKKRSITRQCNHVCRIHMVATYHNHQYANCSLDSTMHERNIQMMLTLYQTDFSISISIGDIN